MRASLKYDFGQIVYVSTDREQTERVVVGYYIRPNGTAIIIARDGIESIHYDFELSTEPDTLMKLK